MDINYDLRDRVHLYTNTLLEIEERRKIWNSSTKAFIVKILDEVVKAYDLGWAVHVNEDTKNKNSVILSFLPHPSGMISNYGETIKEYMKSGGNITFDQQVNGKIRVVINTPSIEKYKENNKPYWVGIFEPSKITEEEIIGGVNTLLWQMSDWEKSNQDS